MRSVRQIDVQTDAIHVQVSRVLHQVDSKMLIPDRENRLLERTALDLC